MTLNIHRMAVLKDQDQQDDDQQDRHDSTTDIHRVSSSGLTRATIAPRVLARERIVRVGV
ncbi:MAG: hypothetical protein H0U40_06895 [Chloroflexia bacterium]|nr:hypothetical protein [Chloroflexia bacterium]